MENLEIWIVAAFFFAMGVLALAVPSEFARPLGLSLTPRRGTNEVRAVYGGFGVVIAGLLIYAADEKTLREGVFVTVSFALYGMAAGRVVSLAIERSAHPVMLAAMVVEAGLATLLMSVR